MAVKELFLKAKLINNLWYWKVLIFISGLIVILNVSTVLLDLKKLFNIFQKRVELILSMI